VAGVLTVLLVHRNDFERAQLRQALEATGRVQIVGERGDVRAGMAMARQVRPTVLLVDANGPNDDALQAASQYRMEHPEVTLFVSTDAYDSETLMSAMRAGAQEVLRRPLDRGALAAAVERVAALRARQTGAAETRQVISVFSTKGGAGVSTIAANLALGLRRATGRGVALVDLDDQSGDAAFLLGLHPTRSFADLATLPRIEGTHVQDVLARHEGGVGVIAQPERIEHVESANGPMVGHVLELLSATTEYVVVDAPHTLAGSALELFDRSSTILLVCNLSVTSVRAARRVLDAFERLNYLAVPDRVRLVVNRFQAGGAVTVPQVEDTLGLPVFATVANDYAAVSQAIDTGTPLCAAEPASRAGRDIDALARSLSGLAVAAAANGPPAARGLRGLFGRRGKA
jgi:pilus assembly protein CpaE